MKIHEPNFFILGAPKCGTTALAMYLDQHPELLFSYPKEPNYFNTDFSEKYRNAPEDYQKYLRKYFLSDIKDPKAVGEGTVWYLYSKDAVKNILEKLPESKFIVLIRDPVELAYAMHATEVFCRHENVEQFTEAWELQALRKEGLQIPPGCKEVKTLLYGEVAKIGEQLERLFKRVPREQVKLIFFEDFIGDTRKYYDDVCTFLDLSIYEGVILKKINTNRTIKNKFLMDILHMLGRSINISNIKKRLGVANRKGVIRWLKNKNSRPVKRAPLDPEFQHKLMEYFKEDIKKIESMTGRDLSHWYSF